MKLLSAFGVFAALWVQSAGAAEYYRNKWFDYPDPTVPPIISNGCAHYIIISSIKCRGFKCSRSTAKICTNPTHVVVSLFRRDVYFVVTGPDNVQQAVQRALAGIATGCAVSAISAAAAAAAATPSPEPVTHIAAAAATLSATFATCISSVSAPAVVGGLVSELRIKIDTSSGHWSRV